MGILQTRLASKNGHKSSVVVFCVLHSVVDSVCTTVPSFQLIHTHVGLVLVFPFTSICDYLVVH